MYFKKGRVFSHIKNSDHLCVWPRSAFTTTGVSIEFKTIVVSNRDIRCITKAYINQNFPTDMYMFDNLTFKIKTSSLAVLQKFWCNNTIWLPTVKDRKQIITTLQKIFETERSSATHKMSLNLPPERETSHFQSRTDNFRKKELNT